MSDQTSFVRFLRSTCIVILLGIAAAIALVVVVDPYRLYRVVDVPGFNAVKPQPDRYQEQIKLSNARRTNASALIFGNSRAEYGLNPEYQGFHQASLSAYNMALSGTKIGTSRRDLSYFKTSGQKPAFILLGVDFLDYLVDATKPITPTVITPVSQYDVNGIKWQFDALFSLTSVNDALKTLEIQKNPEAESISPRGMNPLLEYKKFAREEGYYAIFQQRALEYAKTFSQKPHDLVFPASGSSPELDGLRATLSMIAEDKTDANIIIYPYHAQILAMFEETGLWPAFERWKDLLITEIAATNAKYPDAHIRLWDFSGYGTQQCELIPEKNDLKTVTQWYWEAGHFKQSLGNLILARILSDKIGQSPAAILGTELVADNALENQQRIQQEKARCMANYPALFQQVATLVAAERKKK